MNAKDNTGLTPLMDASWWNRIDIMYILLNAGEQSKGGHSNMDVPNLLQTFFLPILIATQYHLHFLHSYSQSVINISHYYLYPQSTILYTLKKFNLRISILDILLILDM